MDKMRRRDGYTNDTAVQTLWPLYRKYTRTRARQLRNTSVVLDEISRQLAKAGHYEAIAVIDALMKPVERTEARIFGLSGK